MRIGSRKMRVGSWKIRRWEVVLKMRIGSRKIRVGSIVISYFLDNLYSLDIFYIS